jgi:hypothetical protein
LQEADALFLLEHFFMANHEQMIRPYLATRISCNVAATVATPPRKRPPIPRTRPARLAGLVQPHLVHPLAFEKPPGAAEGPGRPAELIEGREHCGQGRHFSEEEELAARQTPADPACIVPCTSC